MDETLTLILLSFAMLVGCYLAGSIPLAMSLSEERLKSVTVLGAGLLVGTALAVIIPEGVHAMYSAADSHSTHSHHSEAGRAVGEAVKEAAGAVVGAAGEEISAAGHDHKHGGMEMHSMIGAALVVGFVFMLLVDQIGGNHHHGNNDAENGNGQSRGKNTATLGLVVHAAADGIALGAAANTSQMHVEMIVFVAIMLHKAPAAFGLVSFLLHEGLDRTRIRKHLAVFSAAAPLLAVITYFSLSQSSKETLSNVNATGIAMLFSAGTFLYVATVHILPELASMGSKTTQLDGTIREQKGFTKCELTLMVIGAFLPLILAFGHSH